LRGTNIVPQTSHARLSSVPDATARFALMSAAI
jgi:hypothetical protein